MRKSTARVEPVTATTPASAIPGIPTEASGRLLQLMADGPSVSAIWLYGSRAMGRDHAGSGLDLCLEGPQHGHGDRLRLPWQVDLSLRHELPLICRPHVQRVGLCLWHAAEGPG